MDAIAAMFKGGVEATSNPHVCPLNPEGADPKKCIALSGKNAELNKNNCCGTQRGTLKFGPCNHKHRRCLVCLEMGRKDISANAVDNVEDGTCLEHAIDHSAERREVRIPADPRVKQRREEIVPFGQHRELLRARLAAEQGDQMSASKAAPKGARGVSSYVPPPEQKPVVVVRTGPLPVPLVKAPDEKTALRLARRALINALSADESAVIRGIAYSWSPEQIDVERKKKLSRTAAQGLADILWELYRKFDLLELTSEGKMRHALGNLYLQDIDARQEEGVSAPAETADTADVESSGESDHLEDDSDEADEKDVAAAEPEGEANATDEALITWAINSVPKLNERQLRMFVLCADGLDAEGIAAILNKSEASIQVAFTPIYGKLGLGHLPRMEKRPMIVRVAKRYVQEHPEVKPVAEPSYTPAHPVTTAEPDKQPAVQTGLTPDVLVCLEDELNRVIDAAASSLKMMGLKRRTNPDR